MGEWHKTTSFCSQSLTSLGNFILIVITSLGKFVWLLLPIKLCNHHYFSSFSFRQGCRLFDQTLLKCLHGVLLLSLAFRCINMLLVLMLMLMLMLMSTIQGGVWKGREEVASLRPKGKEFLREEGRGPIVEAQYKRYNHNLTMVTLIWYDDDWEWMTMMITMIGSAWRWWLWWLRMDDNDGYDDDYDDWEWMTSTELGEGGSGQKAFMLLPTKMSHHLLSSSSSSSSVHAPSTLH